jgi:RIO kinase 2
MELVSGRPLQQMVECEDPGDLYDALMNLLLKFANHGVIHGDFNEFNIMIAEDEEGCPNKPVIIDFPQMISTEHKEAEVMFDRDVSCLRDFFRRRFGYESELFPQFSDVKREGTLDAEIAASGITKTMEKHILTELGLDDSDEDSPDEEDEEEDEAQVDVIDDDIEDLRKEFQQALGESQFVASEAGKDADEPESCGFAEDRDDVESVGGVSFGGLSTASTIAPEVIKQKVRSSLSRQKHQDERRRAKAKGEASAVTRTRRENRNTIKTSTDSIWG